MIFSYLVKHEAYLGGKIKRRKAKSIRHRTQYSGLKARSQESEDRGRTTEDRKWNW